MYQVIDRTGAMVRSFRTEQEAKNWRAMQGRYDWTIKNY